jgi:hypothetical protein
MIRTEAITASGPCHNRKTYVPRSPYRSVLTRFSVHLLLKPLFRDAGMDFQPAGQVLEMVAAAREPMSRKQIAIVADLDAEKELPPRLGRLAAFVPVREGRYSLFHRSLFEWLTGRDTQQDQSFAGLYYLSLQESHKRLGDWGWAEPRQRSLESNVTTGCAPPR